MMTTAIAMEPVSVAIAAHVGGHRQGERSDGRGRPTPLERLVRLTREAVKEPDNAAATTALVNDLSVIREGIPDDLRWAAEDIGIYLEKRQRLPKLIDAFEAAVKAQEEKERG